MAKNMSEDERLTRLAAIALQGTDGSMTDWAWDHAGRALFQPLGADQGTLNHSPMMYRAFSPLTSSADAYTLEDALRMQVVYETHGDAVSIRISDAKSGVATFRTQRVGDSTMKTRMAAVTQHAAVYAVTQWHDALTVIQ
jgi:hypothetical protein